MLVDLVAFNDKDGRNMAQVKSGIYEIINVINGNRYIGSSVDIQARLSVHKSSLNGGYSGCMHLQRAWDKYGEDNFVFSPLMRCKEDELLKWEQFFIDRCEHHYNIQTDVSNGKLMRKKRKEVEKEKQGLISLKAALEKRDSAVFDGLFE